MNAFNYWFDYIVRNGKYGERGEYEYGNETQKVWITNINGFICEAYWALVADPDLDNERIHKIIVAYIIETGMIDNITYRMFLDDNDFKPIFARPIH